MKNKVRHCPFCKHKEIEQIGSQNVAKGMEVVVVTQHRCKACHKRFFVTGTAGKRN